MQNVPSISILVLTWLAVLFPRHLTPQRRYENISHIQTFRDYFHYHIKASKVCSFSRSCLGDRKGLMTKHSLQAYIHTRMRKRTADFLQGMYYPSKESMFTTNSQQCSTELDRRMKNVSARLLVVARSECRVRAYFFVRMSQFKSIVIVYTPFLCSHATQPPIHS